eukprot:CAMPEP_0119007140 /NCGR_PEP_ID=MMETSP1176-20130426/2794_1 /TAXON_ID=265551 /ORGANISM="Synedropsis recta cf, Strain CCMP1620" /LENGTH=462 /DNA_ID=CAMNT_0006959215 /DNA_START=30 /DNA_END=1418 /DNA_ORIENTATION=-
MKVQTIALLAWTVASTEAFVFPAKSFVARSSNSALQAEVSNEFEYLLNENGAAQNSLSPRTRRVMNPTAQKIVQLTSSAAVASPTDAEIDMEYDIGEDAEEEILANSAAEDFDGDAKLSTYQEAEGTNKFTSWIKQADFQEIAWTLFVPSLLALGALKWGVGKANVSLSGSAQDGLESFANEMIYHDGNFDEMQLCKLDWDGRLTWLGPTKKKRMLSHYLEDYAKRKPVSPQAISSISYVFTLFGLSEEQAADSMVAICKAGGAEKISSANKLLFFGNHIFESDEGKAKLQGIKDIIKSTYRSDAGSDAIVDTSQYAMGESAYRSVAQKTGPSNKIPDGWQVLGLKQEAALQIYKEEKEAGFKSASEEIYGGQNEKYNKKGQRVDAKGFAIEEADIEQNAKDAEFETEESTSTSGAFECENCGYTLFVAKGREAKFFGAGFQCPECGSAKDQFKTIDESDME